MGMSNRHWNPPLKFEDFEFENDRLVKIRGMRPMYIEGYALIAAVEQMALIMRNMAPHEDYNPTIGQGYIDRMHRVTPLGHELGTVGMDFGHEPPTTLIADGSNFYIVKDEDVDAHVQKLLETKHRALSPDADPSGPSVPESGSTEDDSDGW